MHLLFTLSPSLVSFPFSQSLLFLLSPIRLNSRTSVKYLESNLARAAQDLRSILALRLLNQMTLIRL